MKRVRPTISAPASPSPFDAAPVLNPFLIRKLAGRKGFIVDTIQTGKGGRRFVRLLDGRSGASIETPRMFGFTLAEAKRFLDQLPDRSPGKGAIPSE
jgi:hypothetical protein